MATIDPDLWRRAREFYEKTDKPLTAIVAELGISQSTVRKRAQEEKWSREKRPSRRRQPQPGQSGLMIRRLYLAVERQLEEIEARMAKPNPSMAEKDARTLGSLARTLEKLIGMEVPKSDPTEADEPVDLDQLYQELADRLHRLSESGG